MLNQIECAYCGLLIESKTIASPQTHSCEAMRKARGEDYIIAADGGPFYWKRYGKEGRDYIERGEE